MKFELDKADIAMILYCLALVVLGSIFLGAEIRTMQFDAEKRANARTLENCNRLITRSHYQ